MIDSNSKGTVTGSRIHYEGGRNITYDLSGSDARFTHEDTIIVYEANQIHTFVIPVYFATNATTPVQNIKVEKLVTGTVKSGEWQEVGYDSTGNGGWKIFEADNGAMSQAYLMDDSFNGTLIKSIQLNILTTVGSKITVRITAQRFYQDLYDFNGFDGIGPSYTPALGKYVLDKLQDIEARVAQNIANIFAVTDTANDMLEEDLTGTLPANYVQDETHEVSTLTGVDTLMPARGSFYSNDFRMWRYTVRTGTVQMANKQYNLENQAIFIYSTTSSIGGTSTKTTTTKRVYLTEENYDTYLGLSGSFIDRAQLTMLVLGKDYEMTNLNVAKTEKSESEYGVYDTIRMLTSFTGNVLITYRAFGGAVVFEDVQDMRQDLLNTMKILSSKNLITSDILEKQPVIRELLDRMLVVEQYHDHFNQVEHAVYMGDTGFHWFNIATLYDVPWGEDLSVMDEIGTFRVESIIRGWCYEFTLSVDLKKKIANALRCKTIATNDVTCSDLHDYMTYLSSRDDVGIRLCWVGDGSKSGIMLQLGWNFDNYPDPVNGVDTDTIIVTNKSGMTSKWRLVYNPLDNTYDATKSRHVCNHTQYQVTQDTTWQADKEYFRFEQVYTYYRTASEQVHQDVQYFTISNTVEGDARVYTEVELTPGNDIADYISGVKTPHCPNGIYERTLYKKVPRLIESSEYVIGEPITDKNNVFEVAGGSYSEDTSFLMPSTKHIWASGVEGCYQLRRILEPSDGLLVWAGNAPLSVYNAKTLVLDTILHPDTRPILDMMTIRGLTVKLYDRKLDKIICRSADVGYSEAIYEETEDTTAQEGKIYYERTGEGTLSSPYHYYRSTVQTGTSLTAGAYFELVDGDRMIGQIIFDLLDLCGAKVEVYKVENTDVVKIAFELYVGTDSYINHRFDLRQIELHF